MSSELIESNEVETDEKSNNRKQKYLLNDESFELLRVAQQRINREIEMTPTLRKLINELVNIEAVDNLVERTIERLK